MPGRVPPHLLVQFSEDTLVFTTRELCDKYHKAVRTICDWRLDAKSQGQTVGYGLTKDPVLQPLHYVPTYTKWEQLEGDVVIAGDFHIPYCDWKLVNRIIPVARKYDIRQLIICGDLFDLAALTGFPKAARLPAWEKELQETEHFIDAMCTHFDLVLDTVGNHLQNRLLKRLEGELSAERFKRLFTTDDKVAISPYPFLKLATRQGTWHITHQRNYSKNSLSVARMLCHKHRSHIMTHHQHRMALGFDESGKYMLIDNGSMADERKMAWMQYQDTTRPVATHGFTVIKNGYPYLFGRHTDWDWALGDTS
jgi:hypothetical protein